MRRAVPAGSVVVTKIGSSSLTAGGSGLDAAALAAVVDQVAAARRAGHPTVLVSSGAVAAGLPALGLTNRPTDVPGLQVAAAVGQGRLMERYTAEFESRGLVAGQVLLTKGVLADRDQYLHAREALTRMLEVGIVPIVNENDTVAVEELRLGDNDRLAALVSHLVNAGLMVLLTDTAGLHASDPRQGDAELLSAVRHTDGILDQLARGGAGPFGSGGIGTKIAAARMAAWSGIPTVIASAADPGALARAIEGGEVGTWVEPQPDRLPARKLWIAFGQPSEGRIRVDAGAARALVEAGRSLLPVGVTGVEGRFEPGMAVEVLAPDGTLVAKGISRFSSDHLFSMKGRRSEHAGGEVIHRDDLVVLVPH
jgi:glutamate 5-kinase